MKSFKSLLGEQQLLPIIQADSVSVGNQIAQAMQAAGIKLVEVVLRTSASLDILKSIKEQFPDLTVGAGTVVDQAVLEAALQAGSDFIVTPAISPKLLVSLAELDIPVLPGVSNTGDILLARDMGFTELKLFPANLSGGHQFIKSVSSVFPDISFCPTGGVNESNQFDYLKLKNCFAVGGTWIAKPEWIQSGDFARVTEACQKANRPLAA